MKDDLLVIHGHRGCKGLRPENTLAAFLHAVEIGVKAIEMDVLCTRDGRLAVVHDPVVSPAQFSGIDGEEITGPQRVVFELHSDELRNYCRKSPPGMDWRPAVNEEVRIPLLAEVVQSVRDYCAGSGKALPLFNIEIKSHVAWDEKYHPRPDAYAELVLNEVHALGVGKECIIQCFDWRLLSELNARDRGLKYTCLSDQYVELKRAIEILGFAPWGYSLEQGAISEPVAIACKEQDIVLLAWTVNEIREFNRLRGLGVRHIITDFPDRIGNLATSPR